MYQSELHLLTNDDLERRQVFIKKLNPVLLIIVISDLFFRLLSVFAPERIEYKAYIPDVLFILLLIPLNHYLKGIKDELKRRLK